MSRISMSSHILSSFYFEKVWSCSVSYSRNCSDGSLDKKKLLYWTCSQHYKDDLPSNILSENRLEGYSI